LATKEGDVAVYVTFRNYVQAEEFNTWAKTVGLRPKHTELRIVINDAPKRLPTNIPRPNGKLSDSGIAIDARPDDTEPLPKARIDEQLDRMRVDYDISEVKGVYFTDAIIKAQDLSKVADDPPVFLADVTRNVVREKLVAEGIAGADKVEVRVVAKGGAINGPSPFDQMERIFGLNRFNK
jgi:hypothetical protein